VRKVCAIAVVGIDVGKNRFDRPEKPLGAAEHGGKCWALLESGRGAWQSQW